MKNEVIERVPWKRYTIAVSEAVIVFTIASFLFGLYIMRGPHEAALTIIVVIACLVPVTFSVIRMVKKFSLAAVMLMIPIAPLVILIIVVSLIQFLELFK